ncbi:MAG: hypothetical protein FJ028_00940 [Chloroflexi bacterium]|nr:hypothetical protein [Chloroflexota bacterium]
MGDGAGAAPADGGEGGARLVRTIVCAYARDALPVAWVQVFRRFEHTFTRAGLDVRVRLHPIDDLPETYEVLVIPPDLRLRSLLTPRGAKVIVTTRENAAAAATDLLAEVQEGSKLRAEPRRADAPRIVTRRGYEEL